MTQALPHARTQCSALRACTVQSSGHTNGTNQVQEWAQAVHVDRMIHVHVHLSQLKTGHG
jgi:hypothetical protein